MDDTKKIVYTPEGTCARSIELTISDGIVTDVQFVGGCAGNSAGMAKLAIGMKAGDVAEKLSGITCGLRGTSCPDQLAKAILSAGE